jgi:hypothetical protein
VHWPNHLEPVYSLVIYVKSSPVQRLLFACNKFGMAFIESLRPAFVWRIFCRNETPKATGGPRSWRIIRSNLSSESLLDSASCHKSDSSEASPSNSKFSTISVFGTKFCRISSLKDGITVLVPVSSGFHQERFHSLEWKLLEEGLDTSQKYANNAWVTYLGKERVQIFSVRCPA